MKKFCLVCSGGGHLTEILEIKKNSNIKKYFLIINSKIKLQNKKKYFVSHGVRGIKLIFNFFEIFYIFLKERPDIIISTGASVALPAYFAGKLFFNTKFIFFETITRTKSPSISGKIMYKFSNEFYYQWKNLRKFYPKGKYYNILNNL
jgi:UDP-N-acetylglucosamine:LPS N-acetylglucosamine transferase